MVDGIGIVLCFQTESMTGSIQAAALSGSALLHIVCRVEMDSRHCGIHLHGDACQIRHRDCGRPKCANQNVHNETVVIATCLDKLGKVIVDMRPDMKQLPQNSCDW